MKNNTGLLSNLSWKFAERISAQLVTLFVSIVLARLLEPSHYGMITLVTVFISLANVFVTSGFGSALIQKKDADALDFSSVLYFNVGFSIVLYLLLFFGAPHISALYGNGYELLTPVIRVLGLRVILCAINSVQQAYVSRKMMFRKFFYSTLSGTVISAIVGVGMAYAGFGVWALVAQYLTNTTVDTLVLMATIHKRPILKFSLTRIKEMLSYGLSILGTGLLITGFTELRSLLIGKVYTPADLAYYNKGSQFPNIIVTNINESISSVLFPKLSAEKGNRSRFKGYVKQSVRMSAYIMCPLMLGLAVISPLFVKIILTEKWLPCVPLLQLFCIEFMLFPIHSVNMQAIKAMGRGDIHLKVEIIKKVIELVVLLGTVWISVEVMAVSMMLLKCVFTYINAYPNKKLIGYSFSEQVKDMIQPIGMSVIMYMILLVVAKIPLNSIIVMALQIVLGGVMYIGMSVLCRNKEFFFIVNLVMQKLKKQDSNLPVEKFSV